MKGAGMKTETCGYISIDHVYVESFEKQFQQNSRKEEDSRH
jgi:hypothetical protein